MKIYIADIFLYDTDDEYDYIIPGSIYKEVKGFDQKVKALNYLRDVRKLCKKSKRYDVDDSQIIEQDL